MPTRPAFLKVNSANHMEASSFQIRLHDRLTVGRDEDNDVSFQDSMLSRHHAEFRSCDGYCAVRDLDSTYGTYVNHTRIRDEVILRDGDLVAIGATTFVFGESRTIASADTADNLGMVMAEIKPELTTRTMRSVVDVGDLYRLDHCLGVVCKAANTMVAHHALPDFFDKAIEAIFDAIPAERAAIMVLEGQPPEPVLKAGRSRNGTLMQAIPADIVKRAIEGRKAFLEHDFPEGSRLRDAFPGENVVPIGSVMCAPLWASTKEGEGRVLGLVYLEGETGQMPLTQKELHVLVMLANIAATKIENGRLIEDSLRQQRIEDDIHRAAEIQSELLPHDFPVIEGYRVCGATEPCRLVGGDYFDLDYDGRTLMLALADVSGKGTGAAMLMMALRATVRAHWREDCLGTAVAHINRTFHQTVPPDKYATFFLARLDPSTGRLEYVNAGHNQPLLVRPNGDRSLLGEGGTVVGAFPEEPYRQETVVIDPGACLLVFSDGISDAWRDQEEADRQLAKLIVGRRRGETPALGADIFRAAEKARDDRTLVIIERLAGEVAAARL